MNCRCVQEKNAELLTITKNDIHAMICDNNIHDDDYQGLDSTLDTEAQAKTALRLFPEVLSQPCGNNGEGVVEYPIQHLCFSNKSKCNEKVALFIAPIAQLATEFRSFEDDRRGGLLIEDDTGDNTFRNLMYNFDSRVPGQNQLILTLFIRLRRMGLFKKEDIRDYHLVSLMRYADDLPERGFQFLVEWDPPSLIQTDDDGWLPLHWAAQTSIQGFQIVFSYGIRCYPYKKGIRLLFQKNDDGDTPFQYACRRHGRDVVSEIIEEILTRYHSEGTPLHIEEALIVTAADENVHLDCSYFLLRREPDVLLRLL